MDWFRMYSEARNDKKLNSLTDAQFRVWHNLLCFSNEQKERGVIPYTNIEKLALEVSNENIELLEETLQSLESPKREIIERNDTEIIFINFVKRQYDNPSDRPERVRERVTKHRETTMKRDVTICNAEKRLYPDTDNTNTQSISTTPPNPPKGKSIFFDQAYDLYPKKKAREDSLKAWKQVNGDIHFDKIRDAIYKQARSPDWLKEDKKYVPLFASWLRGKRWEDETDEKHEGNSEPLGVDGKPLGYWERGLKYWSDDDGGTIPTVPGDDI